MSAISGFCEKCNKFRKRHCDGNRNTCMSILFDTIEALQQENEQLKAQAARMKEALRKAREEVQNALDNYELVGEHEYDISEHLQIALTAIDKAIGGKEDVTSMGD